MEAITVKFIALTNQCGARLKAKCAAGSIVVGYPQDLDQAEAHEYAFKQLMLKLNWDSVGWASGVIHTGEYVYVCMYVRTRYD